jgi:hypothetical protein
MAQQEEELSVGNAFIRAFDNQDEAAMKNLIKTRSEEVPVEVQAMVEYAISPDASPQEQDFLFNIAGTMAQMYGEVTGDDRLLSAVMANYQSLLDKRKAASLPPDSVKKVKDELLSLGKGDWRIMVFKLDSNKGLLVEIDMRIDMKEPVEGESFTPTVDFKTSQKARDIVKKELPGIKKGRISWSNMGIGLKTVFIE